MKNCLFCGQPMELGIGDAHAACAPEDDPRFVRIQHFTWNDPDSPRQIEFYVTEMIEAMLLGELPYEKCRAALNAEWAAEWLPQRDLNMNYVRSIAEPKLSTPMLGVRLNDADDSVLIIDGSHRYMARYLAKKEDYLLMIIPYPAWRRYSKETRNG